jgi:hypothetical protein
MDETDQIDQTDQSAARRIRAGDCLYTLYLDLRAQARTLLPWDADARETWLAACGQLLAQVPSAEQRFAWAYWLARQVPLRDAPLKLVIGLLLARATSVRRCDI